MKRILLGILAFVFFVPGVLAQKRQITGTIVSSEDGQPVIGVTVQDKTTGTYAVSDPFPVVLYVW